MTKEISEIFARIGERFSKEAEYRGVGEKYDKQTNAKINMVAGNNDELFKKIATLLYEAETFGFSQGIAYVLEYGIEQTKSDIVDEALHKYYDMEADEILKKVR